VIIGYLHLAVLGFVSFFLLGFFIRTELSAEAWMDAPYYLLCVAVFMFAGMAGFVTARPVIMSLPGSFLFLVVVVIE